MIHKKIITFITFIFLNFFNYLYAHEIKPAVVEFNKIENHISIVFKFNAEAFLANIDASVHKETKNSSNSKIYDELRLLSEEILKERVFKSKDQITNSIFIKTSEKTFVPHCIVASDSIAPAGASHGMSCCFVEDLVAVVAPTGMSDSCTA